MNKKSILWLTISLAGVFSFCYYGQCQPSKEVNWNYMGVYAARTIPAGVEVEFQDLEQKQLSNSTKPTILADNIKSTFSAVDRRAKRTISKGELLMKKDFGVQTPMVGRPHPENEIY